jgi:hypothetical protein
MFLWRDKERGRRRRPEARSSTLLATPNGLTARSSSMAKRQTWLVAYAERYADVAG